MQYIFLLFSFVLSLIIISLSNNMLLHVVVFALFTTVPILLVRCDITHPYCWFSAFLFLYSVAYPVLHIVSDYKRYGYDKEIIIYPLIALFIFLIVVSPRRIEYKESIRKRGFKIETGQLNKFVYVAMVLLILAVSIYVSRNGYSGKNDIYINAPFWVQIIFRFPLIITIMYGIFVVSYYAKKNQLPKKQMVAVGTSLAIITIFSGERDFIFRFIIITIMILWAVNIVRLKHLFLLVPIAAMIIPLSNLFKYYFLRGTVNVVSDNFLVALLYGEFESAGRNLQELINNSLDVKGFAGVERIVEDIFQTVIPGIDSCVRWFQKTFHPMSTTGYGFTLVGEGYIIGGEWGIVLLFLIVGFMSRYFYFKSNKNGYFFTAYMYYITLIIYSIRADFATIMSGIVSQMLPVIAVVYVLQQFLKNKVCEGSTLVINCDGNDEQLCEGERRC